MPCAFAELVAFIEDTEKQVLLFLNYLTSHLVQLYLYNWIFFSMCAFY
jgi:hypothetical protein